MGNVHWDFPLKGSGNEQGYANSGIEMFKGKRLIENVAREICQNSLDAKDPKCNAPVKICFELRKINKDEYPLFQEYKECLEGCRENWNDRMDRRLREFLETADEMMKKSSIPVLVISDYNTKGLEGVDAEENKSSVWRDLAHSDGTSSKGSDSAGSYGIGKNAPFACSALSMVFYNTYAIDGGRALQGTSRLATILRNGKQTQGVGHYLYYEDDSHWGPIRTEHNCSFMNEFKRDLYGTDVIIVGFSEEKDWASRMKRAIISNFFLALYQKRLVVEVSGDTIDNISLASEINYFKSAPLIEGKSVYECYNALTNPDDGEIIHLSVLEENDVALYLKSERDYHNKVAFFRSNGMRICFRSYDVCQRYAAVVVVEKEKLGGLLREAEPVRHDKWDHKLISNKERRKEAKDSLEKMRSLVKEALREKYEKSEVTRQDCGEGDYLPDVNDVDQSQLGNDILRVHQKLGPSYTRIPNPDTIHTGMRKKSGNPKAGDAYSKNRKNLVRSAASSSKRADVDSNTRSGVLSGSGMGSNTRSGADIRTGSGPNGGTMADSGKSVNPNPLSKPNAASISTPAVSKDDPFFGIVNLTFQKVFLFNQERGLYKVVLCSEKDYPNVKLSFCAVGEDGGEDMLTIRKYIYCEKTQKVRGTSIGPISLSGGVRTEMLVMFTNKEKMRLNIIAEIMEES